MFLVRRLGSQVWGGSRHMYRAHFYPILSSACDEYGLSVLTITLFRVVIFVRFSTVKLFFVSPSIRFYNDFFGWKSCALHTYRARSYALLLEAGVKLYLELYLEFFCVKILSHCLHLLIWPIILYYYERRDIYFIFWFRVQWYFIYFAIYFVT